MTSTIQLLLLLCEVIKKIVKECGEKRKGGILPLPSPLPSFPSLSFSPFSSSFPIPSCYFFQEEEVGEEREGERGKEREVKRGRKGRGRGRRKRGKKEVQKVKSTWQWWFAIWECQQRCLDWSISANQDLPLLIDVVPV